MFDWGGCGGNANNYETLAECQGACTDLCGLPADVGPCDAAIPRWYYNAAGGSCELFTWGGCGGNANNFENLTGCQDTCTDVCRLPADVGPCAAVIPRWFFNDQSGECELFNWGGCGGNSNNFETRFDCENRCR